MKAEIGEYYSVPCIQFPKGTRMVWVPVMGERLADPELGNPRPHYHIDYRFMTPAMFLFYFGKFNSRNIQVIADVDGVYPLAHRRLKCYREFELIHPSPLVCGNIGTVDMHTFEQLMSKAKVTERDGCKFCPHKGMSLDGAKHLSQDIVECPGHGLAWNLVTGKLHAKTAPYDATNNRCR